MEGNRLRLNLALLHVDLVAAEDDGDVLADTDEITCVSLGPASLLDMGAQDLRCQLGTFL